MTEKVTSDAILNWVKSQVESKNVPSREMWIDIAFRLTFLRIDEAKLYNQMQQAVSAKKLEILKSQDKKNVAAADIEVRATDKYRFLKDQEDKIYSIDEFVRIAKRSADIDLWDTKEYNYEGQKNNNNFSDGQRFKEEGTFGWHNSTNFI